MQTSNGQPAELNSLSAPAADGTRHVPKKVSVLLTESQAEFIKYLSFHGVAELSASLRMVHDMALYHSDLPIDTDEKAGLYALKILWEGLEEMGKEA